ncbi:MAG: outer membrane beta-barrel protein, partial [Bacteroidota bacterium]|nr:outer membrane beta-barrel protein [Bacteroidota bacterium]
MLRLHGILKAPFLVILVLWLAPVSMNGQALNAGFFAGINASQVDGDSYSGFNKLGLNAGFFVNRLIDYKIYWQGELRYGTRGVYQGPTDNSQTLYKSSYHILELALSVNYLYDERIQVEVGTSPELLLAIGFWDEYGLMDPSTYPENRRFGLSVFGGIGFWFSDKIMAGL